MVSQVLQAKAVSRSWWTRVRLLPRLEWACPAPRQLLISWRATTAARATTSAKPSTVFFGSFWALGPSRVTSEIKTAHLFPFVARKNVQLFQFLQWPRKYLVDSGSIDLLNLRGASVQPVIHLLKHTQISRLMGKKMECFSWGTFYGSTNANFVKVKTFPNQSGNWLCSVTVCTIDFLFNVLNLGGTSWTVYL